jgi:hypothetical protein
MSVDEILRYTSEIYSLNFLFFGSFTMCPSFHSAETSSTSQIFSNSSYRICTDVSMSALSASAGMYVCYYPFPFKAGKIVPFLSKHNKNNNYFPL